MSFLRTVTFFFLFLSPLVGFPNSTLLKVTRIEKSPIIFKADSNAYYIVWEVEESGKTRRYELKLKYDPFTGEALDSDRDLSFVEPDQDEISRIRSKLNEFDTIADVIAFYGEPDRVVEKHGGGTQYDFESGFDTIKLILTVNTEGEVLATYLPKKKKRD